MWETVLQPFVESIANALPHTRVGDRMPGKNRGKKRKTQYCLPYTRRGNQLWQPICPFLRFRPYTYGEAPAVMAAGRFGSISSLHVWGSPHAHDPSLTCHVVFPTCTGESPRRPAMPEPEAGLPYITGEFPQPSRSHAPDAAFRKAGSLSACTACAPMLRAGMDGLSWGRVFPGPFFALFLARDSDAQ